MKFPFRSFPRPRPRPSAGGVAEPRLKNVGLMLGVLLMLAGSVAQAQPGSGGPGPGTPDPSAVPLDGGASLLLAGGVSYAIRRLRRKRA